VSTPIAELQSRLSRDRVGTGALTNDVSATIFAAPLLRGKGDEMVSSTQQFERIRKRKMTTNGKRNKRMRRRLGTPSFPIHPEGYNSTAPDAKKSIQK